MKQVVSRQGFTLIELLVVISIIGILVTLTSGVVFNVRNEARRAACEAQLHDIGNALHMARDEIKQDLGVPAWATLLVPYVGDEVDVFRCPTDFTNQAIDDGPSSTSIDARPSYGINHRIRRMARGSGDGHRIALLEYKVPVAEVALPDSTAGLAAWEQNAAFDRHTGYLNVLYFGGHTGYAEYQDIDPNDCDTRFKLWQPYYDQDRYPYECDDGSGGSGTGTTTGPTTTGGTT
ncbi:MAG: type II secretion system protein [Planctomycetota bacterium]|nr:MAG: type II secretion system protein [Planctomycetota bacterium]